MGQRGKKQWTWWTSSCYFSSICAISWPKRQFSYADFMRFARNLVIFMLIMLIICIFASFLLIFCGIKYICDILYVFCLSTLDWKMDFFSLSSKLFQIKPEHRTFLPNVYDMFCVRHKCNAFRENSFPGISSTDKGQTKLGHCPRSSGDFDPMFVNHFITKLRGA